MSEIVKAVTHELDGFDAFESAVEGEEGRASSSLIQGDRISFTNEATWVITNSSVRLPPDLELLVWDVLRVVNKWPVEPGAAPIESRVLGPGEKIPDLKKLNNETPQEEWRMGPSGQMEGPFQFQYLIYLFDEKTSARYTWATSTIGGAICVRDCVERTNFMRKYKGARVHARVKLFNTFMNTRFGGRQRPQFIYMPNWVRLGESEETAALPGPEQVKPPGVKETLDQFAKDAKLAAKVVTKMTEPQAQAKTAAPKQPTGLQVVNKPTAKEVTGDEIPW
jgi:hypothetical protein